MSRRLAAVAAMAALLSGCASGPARNAARPSPPCAFASCKADPASLAALTAGQLGLAAGRVEIVDAQPQFAGAVLVWRARVSAKLYDCREGRDPHTGAVHYVACKPSDGKAAPTAFP